MYKHILIAVDGSDLADKAMMQGLELAKAIGARVTLVYVTPPWASIAVGEVGVMFPPQDYEEGMEQAAAKLLETKAETAKGAGIEAATVHMTDPQPYVAILATAAERGADLVVMGSHGRRGIAGLILGSETTKTLTHSKIPVLVYRE